MAEYLSPGVYVEEFESGGKPMEGVGTSTAGFIGLAEKGAAEGVPQLVTNFADFKRKYGGTSPRMNSGITVSWLMPWSISSSTEDPALLFRVWFRAMPNAHPVWSLPKSPCLPFRQRTLVCGAITSML